MIKTKAIIFTGTFVGLLAFVADFFGFDGIARPVFMVGLGVALVGVTLTIFFPSNANKASQKISWSYRLSIIGFLLAAASIMLGNHLDEADWTNTLFNIGAGMFVIFAVLPMFLSNHKSSD